MANHKSAKKRSRQSLKRKKINSAMQSRIKNNLNNFKECLSSKKEGDLVKYFSLVNSSLARASKKGLIKKEYMSKKLSSLSKQLKKI